MAGKVKILVVDDVFIEPLKRLPTNKFTVSVKKGISNEDILKLRADVLAIRSTRKLNKDFLEKFYGSMIATFTKGLDHIDTEFAKRRGIVIINSSEGNSQSAAEHTLMLMLAASKNLILSDRIVRKDKFKKLDYNRTELFGKTVGIIGYGSIGKRVGMLCKAFSMDVIANDIDKNVASKNKNVTFKSVNYLLRNSDFVTLHIPLDGNFNFLSKEKLSLLKEDCILVNTSRGEVIDENHLIKMLKTHKIRSAALDVFRGEPEINPLLFRHDNIILSNHVAGKTKESKRRISEDITLKILTHFK